MPATKPTPFITACPLVDVCQNCRRNLSENERLYRVQGQLYCPRCQGPAPAPPPSRAPMLLAFWAFLLGCFFGLATLAALWKL